MKIQYLGTAAAEGIPAIWCECEVCRTVRLNGGKDVRTRSQAIIDDQLMVDLPPDAYAHMLYYGLVFAKIRNVIFTHSHQDHFYPEDLAMRSENYAHGVGPIGVYGNDEVKRRILSTNEMQIGERIVPHEVRAFEPFEIDDYTVTPLKANHDPKENCLIYLISRDGKTLLYGNDTGEFPKETWDYLVQTAPPLNLVSLDCTMGKTDFCRYHMGVPNVLRTRDKLRALRLVTDDTVIVVTHFSHNGYIFYDELRRLLESERIIPSFDGMILEV